MAKLLLGIDVGTTSTKAVLLDPDRGLVASAQRSVSLHSVHTGWAEADTAIWWRNLRDLVPHLLGDAGCGADAIAGIAVSGMVPAVVVVGPDGAALRHAILQNDARAGAEIDELARAMDPQTHLTATGSALTQQSVAPTLMWLRRHEPEIYSRADAVLGSYDWLACRLGAPPHVEQNWAIESGLFHLDSTPFEPALAAGGVETALLPKVGAPAEPIGEVSPWAAEQTGLAKGTPIFVGGADHVLSAFAAGLVGVGDWLVKLGGGGDILVVADAPLTDPRLYLDAHPRPGLWLPNGCMATSGSLVRWLSTLVDNADMDGLGELAAQRPVADVLCLPYFLGEKSPLHDVRLRGAFVGLDLSHDAASLYRAVLEGVAFGFRHHVDVFEECQVALRGGPKVSNGGAGSPIWKQIHADVLGRPVTPVLRHPGASLGAAMLAGIGVGTIDRDAAPDAFVEYGEPVEPLPANVARYDAAYQTWLRLSTAMTPISHELADREN